MKIIKALISSIAIALFLLVILSLGAVGFLVFTAVMLGVFVYNLNSSFKRI